MYRALAAASLALIVASCGSPSPIPPAEAARAALETSLTAWRDGKKPASTAEATPPVQSVDSEWQNGRKLASFEVVREEPSESDKRFLVRLRFANPPAETEAIYVVLGTQTLAVFREADFQRTMNMDNNPTATAKKRR